MQLFAKQLTNNASQGRFGAHSHALNSTTTRLLKSVPLTAVCGHGNGERQLIHAIPLIAARRAFGVLHY